jgi:zinc protease
MALMAILAELFPPEHPYSWMTIGSAEDLRAMQFEDVQAFFRTYYHPSNASLVLAGDLSEAEGFALAERYFGELPAGEVPAPVRAPDGLPSREKRLLLEDRVELPRVYFAWHSPAMFAAGDAEMDLLGDLLANGKTSRLYRALVYEARLAVDVSAYQSSRELGSFFLVAATAAPGRSLTEVGAALDGEIHRLGSEGPTGAEMERVLAQAEAQFIYRLQTVGGFGGKSDQLNAYNVLKGDPAFFAADLDRYRTATAEDVRNAARAHLVFDRRVALSVVPKGQTALALPGSSPVVVS